MNQRELKSILNDVKSFPSMPAVALKLLKLLKDENTSNAQIEQILLQFRRGLTPKLVRLHQSTVRFSKEVFTGNFAAASANASRASSSEMPSTS